MAICDRTFIQLKCPYCGTKQEINVENKAGFEVKICRKCIKPFSFAYELEVHLKYKKLVMYENIEKYNKVAVLGRDSIHKKDSNLRTKEDEEKQA